jgi:hypothetical protein
MINAACFLAVIGSLLILDADQLHPTTPAPRRPGELRDGFRYAAGVPEIIRPLIMMALIESRLRVRGQIPPLAHDTFRGRRLTAGCLARSSRSRVSVYAAFRPNWCRPSRPFSLPLRTTMTASPASPRWPAIVSALVGLPPSSHHGTPLSSLPPTLTTAAGSWPLVHRPCRQRSDRRAVVGTVSEALDPRAAVALGALACLAAGAVSLASPREAASPRERDIQGVAVNAAGVKSGD